MAIEKTVFSGQNKETRGAEIVAWLTANGSEFFDSVEQTSDCNFVNAIRMTNWHLKYVSMVLQAIPQYTQQMARLLERQ